MIDTEKVMSSLKDDLSRMGIKDRIKYVKECGFAVKSTNVIISIHPKWCELIFSGKKKLEIRKRVPNARYPITFYVYQTIDKNWKYNLIPSLANKQGKVVGTFTCNDIDHWESEFWLEDKDVYEAITMIEEDEFEPGEYIQTRVFTNEWEDWEIEPEFEKTLLYKDSCVSWSELRNYMKSGWNDFYTIHVEDVYYFTNPLNISDFQNKNGKVLTRAPQSWCYCEVCEN